MARRFAELNAQEVLALAMDIERANAERYASLADFFKDYEPAISSLFEGLSAEEQDHIKQLEEAWKIHFSGEEVPKISEHDVEDVIEAFDDNGGEYTVFDKSDVPRVLKFAHEAEKRACEFYQRAVQDCQDSELRDVYLRLAELEAEHKDDVENLKKRHGVSP